MWLLSLAVGLLPANPIRVVARPEMAAARDRWLRALLLLGGAWLATRGEVWLAVLAIWVLCRWRDIGLHPTLVFWASVGATWGLLRTLSASAFEWIAWGWLVIAAAHVMLCVQTWYRNGAKITRRGKGLLGSPVLTSFLFVLVAPLCPWWGWPVLAVGLLVTCSWTAFLALGVVALWMIPSHAPFVVVPILAAALLRAWNPTIRGVRLWEWTPRGDSLDAVTERLTMSRLLLWGWWTGQHRWLGLGPGTAERAGQQWGSRCRVTLPVGEAHNDPLQALYEYGLVGAVAMIAFVVPILLQLRLGDPWSAAWVAGAVISLVHWPWRHPALGLMLLAISARLLA